MNSTVFNISANDELTLQSESMKIIPNAIRNLSEVRISEEYTIKDVIANDKELISFLFTLGCFKGESITVISILADNYVIAVKDARYSIDGDLAKAIMV